MNEIIVGIFTVIGAIIGGFFSILSQIIINNKNKKKERFLELADQVRAYYNLEKEYIDFLSINDPNKRAPMTIKKDFREIVQSKIGIRPEITENMSEKIKKEWNI